MGTNEKTATTKNAEENGGAERPNSHTRGVIYSHLKECDNERITLRVCDKRGRFNKSHSKECDLLSS